MPMFFGKQTVRHEYGVFSSDTCPACGKGTTFRLLSIRQYIVVLFAKLLPASIKYETVCEECEESQTLDKDIGRNVAKKYFAESHRAVCIADALKTAVAVVIIAAIIAVPVAIIGSAPVADPQVLKNLVSEDGLYSIQNAKGDVLGIVEVSDGEKLVTFLDDSSVLVGEPGAGSQFIRHEHYKEQRDADGETTLVRIAESPGMLKDKHGIIVREYFYSKVSNKLGYEKGVEDLSAIEYTPKKAVYPFSYYLGGAAEPSLYTVVLFIEREKRFEATFTFEHDDPALVTLFERDYENGRPVREIIYQFDDAAIALAQQAGLSPQSLSKDIQSFLETHKPAALVQSEFTYYKNTRVPLVMNLSVPGSDKDFVQSFEVTQKGAYYIVRALSD